MAWLFVSTICKAGAGEPILGPTFISGCFANEGVIDNKSANKIVSGKTMDFFNI